MIVNKLLHLSEKLLSCLRVELIMASPPPGCWRIKRTNTRRLSSGHPAHNTCSGNAGGFSDQNVADVWDVSVERNEG